MKSEFLKIILLCTLVAAQNYDFDFGKAMSAPELSDSVHILLDSLSQSLRLTALVDWNVRFADEFIRCFTRKGRLAKLLAVAPIDEKYFPENVDQHHEVILIDLGHNYSAIEALVYKKLTRMNMHFKWIFINTNALHFEKNTLLNVTLDKPILPRSDVFYIAKISYKNYVFNKVYKISMNTTTIKEPFGVYEKGYFIKYDGLQSGLEKRRNLQGKHFNGVTLLQDKQLLETFRNYKLCSSSLNCESIHLLFKYSLPTTDTYTKTSIWLYTDLMQYANATLSTVIEKGFGSFDRKTGKWSYLFGRLQDRSADFSVFPFFVIENRVAMLQYLVTTHELDAAFIFRRPGLAATDNVFLFPFDGLVWICTALLNLLLFVFVVGVILLERRMNFNQKQFLELNRNQTSLGDAFMLVFGASCQQGTSAVQRSFTSRLVTMCAFISLMFLFVSYSAYIVVLLQSPSNKIQSLQNLYDSRLKLSLHNNSYNVQMFKTQTEPLRKAIFDKKIKNTDGSMNMFSTQEGIRLVRDGSVALHMEQTVGYREMGLTFHEHEKCALKTINYVPKSVPYVAMVKNSSYYEVVLVGMLRIMEHGLHNRHFNRIYTPKPDCTGNTAIFTSASLLDTMPAFLVLAWGFGGTLVILLAEILCRRYNVCFRLRSISTHFVETIIAH